VGNVLKFLAWVLLAVVVYPSRGQVYPPGFAEVQIANGINTPTVLAFTPDGRILICEQSGKIRLIKDGVLQSTAFLQLSVNSTGERGLIGLAIDPDFENNQFFYVYYTVPVSPMHNRISRFTADGDAVVPGSEVVVLELDNLSTATNHNGGAIRFGADGMLYVAIGENATPANAQNLDTYLGKFLRINKDGSIPPGNPFLEGSDQKRRIWAYGVRNPYTFSVQPGSGKIFINDVGQNTWEEIDDASVGGLNFGWPAKEGLGNDPAFTDPVYAYPHGPGDGNGCAITGGTFFNPSSTDYPGEYFGRYFFQDYCNGWINFIDLAPGSAVRSEFATGLGNYCLGLTVGNDGNLYYLSRTSKALYKIIYSESTTPFITAQPVSATVTEGSPVRFEVKALGTAPLQYQWYRNGQSIPGAMQSTLEISNVEPGDAGSYKVLVSNETGSVESSEVLLTVINVNDIPIARITSPHNEETYVAGSTLLFAGTGIDEEDGVLPANAYSWNIVFHHDGHIHDQPAIDGITEGEYVIPDEGETADNVWYEIILTVVDLDGLEGSDTVNIFPRKSIIQLSTDPPGLQLLVDDQPFETPGSVVSVEGMKRRFGPVSPQMMNEVTYEFDRWKDGGDESKTIVTPPNDTTFIALFAVVLGVRETSLQYPIAVFPNPVLRVDQTVEITIPSTKVQPVSVYVFDLLSRNIQQFDGILSIGENAIPIDAQLLGNGMYGVVVEVGKWKMITKLLIAR
jgi:glucose/arabinose dehydrogenase